MSLYNEVRPKTLSEVKGQEAVIAQIRAILKGSKIPNVSLFVGPRGTGKTTVARIFAKAINCEHPTEDGPCNICATCEVIDAQGSFDVVELDAASHNKVDDVHALIDATAYAPTGKYKVYIIDEVHMLSTAAFNALLKLLEEPPAYCRFILCTTEEHKVPVTIMSRCRKFYFEKIKLDVVAEKMASICSSRNIPYKDDALRMIAKKSEGCMRDAESLLEIFLDAGRVAMDEVANVLGTADEETIFGILTAIISGNAAKAISLLREYSNRGKSLEGLVNSFIEALSDTVYYLQSGDGVLIDNSDSYKKQLTSFSASVTVEKSLELMKGFTSALPILQKGGNTGFALETRLLNLIHTESEVASIKRQVVQLEETCEALKEALYEGVSPSESLQIKEERHFVPHEEVPQTVEEPPADSIAVSNEDALVSSNTRPVSSTSVDSSFFVNPHFDDVLPGDISVPAGTKVVGTISIFGNVSNTSDGLNNENITNVTSEPLSGVALAKEEQSLPFAHEKNVNVSEISSDGDEPPFEEIHGNDEALLMQETGKALSTKEENVELYDEDLFSGFLGLEDIPIFQTLKNNTNFKK